MEAVMNPVACLVTGEQLIECDVRLRSILSKHPGPLAVEPLDRETPPTRALAGKELLSRPDARRVTRIAWSGPLLDVQRVAARHERQPLPSRKSTRRDAPTM
jgi:hypothetical protein